MRPLVLPFLLWFCLMAPAQAQVAPDLGAEAELHFELGVDAYQKRDYQKALEHLMLSNRLAANHKVMFNIGRAYEALGEWRLAWTHYADFVAMEEDPDKRAQAEEALQRLAGKVALVSVRTQPEGAALFVDRRDLGQRGAGPRSLAVRPGNRLILAERPGFAPASVAVDAVVGQTAEVLLELAPMDVRLQVDGSPEGALVRAPDGSELGTLPGAWWVSPGPGSYAIEAPGHLPATLDLDVPVGAPMAVSVALRAATAVVVVGERAEGARIEVNGELMGFAPSVVSLPVGAHRVVVRQEGFLPATIDLDLQPEDAVEIDPRLVPLTEVTAASRVPEELLDTPGTVVVVDRQDLRDRSYSDLADVISDLPGFDAVLANGVTYLVAYQRGYRTPQTQRTLLMTDGQTENLLWSQSAELSRQLPMSDVERIEVLYGPASAVYGPNAFLGVIDVVTVGVDDLSSGEQQSRVLLHGGSWNSRGVDGMVRGRQGALGYVFAARYFASDEPDLSGRWGFTTNQQLADEGIWGPLVNDDNLKGPWVLNGQALGTYVDPTEDWGARGRVMVGGLELGAQAWQVNEAYGPYYATDRAQTSPVWTTGSRRVWGRMTGQPNDALHLTTELRFRSDEVGGAWAEADPDQDNSSWVSLTHWRAPASSWQARQRADFELTEAVQLQTGVRVERKHLSRAYDVPGYWEDSFSSAAVEPGSGIAHSSDPIYTAPPPPLGNMPQQNLATTDDVGGFAQGIVDTGPLRFHGGVRADWGSIVGNWQVSPRAAASWRFAKERAVVKLVYGRAYQEPSARQKWSGWQGRIANDALDHEKVHNLELAALVQTADLRAGATIFGAQYQDVIKEEAENAGNRQIAGAELLVEGSVGNPMPATETVDLYTNYSFTTTRSSVSWSAAEDAWLEQPSPIGDIAPHKLNSGVIWPLNPWSTAHLRSNFVGKRLPYSRNPMRASGDDFPAYFLMDGVLAVHRGAGRLALEVDNLLDSEILQPGAEGANAGNDFDERSLGYHNSAIPLPGRSWSLTLTLEI